jgi:hypothetical protein
VPILEGMRPRSLALAALAVTGAGLVLLFVGLESGVPLVFWGTEEERAARETGRATVVAAAAVLVVAGALLAAAGRPLRAAAVAAPGLVTAALTFGFPEAGWAWFGFLVLAPAAAGTALATALAPRGAVDGEARRYTRPSAGP